LTSRTVHLGFEVTNGSLRPSLARVEIPIKHMAVTGQTQESGKTTALEAMISRSGLASIAFLTKRGEQSFAGATRVPAYFQERADWQFVEAILESSMKQRMKFERAWIVKACKGAHTLADVQFNVAELQARSKRSMDQDLYMLLGEYLGKVVPLIRALPKGSERELEYRFGGEVHRGAAPGLSVMDVTAFPEELQMLVISSTLEWIHRHATGVITLIPEAWKFIPQGRNTPVKIVAEKLAREGAALRNYLWIDSQDMAAVDKMVLRACAVWLIGVQREANEIKRALSNMPAGLKKPKAEAVATLDLGQFFACYGSEILKAYVQPAWMDDTVAGQIASGRLSVHDLAVTAKSPSKASDHLLGLTERQDTPKAKEPVTHGDPGKGRSEFSAGSAARSHSPAREAAPQTIAQEEAMPDQQTLKAIRLAITDGAKDTALRLFDSLFSEPAAEHAQSQRSYMPAESLDNEQLYQAFKARLLKEAPALIKLTVTVPEIELTVLRKTVSMSTDSLDGNVAVLIHEGFFESPRGNAETVAELNRRGWKTISPRMAESFARFNKIGFLYRENDKYRQVADAKKRVVAA